MTKWLRSEEMEYVHFMFNEEAAHSCIERLGTIGAIQFVNLNTDISPFQCRFAASLHRCEVLRQKLLNLREEIENCQIPVKEINDFSVILQDNRVSSQKTGPQLLESLEVEVEESESRILELNNNKTHLKAIYNEKVEYQEVVLKTQEIIANEVATNRARSGSGSLDVMTLDLSLRFSTINGALPQKEKSKFERMIFRVSRGNIYMKFADMGQAIQDENTGILTPMSVFVFYYSSEVIGDKIKRICQAFGARIHNITFDLLDRTTATNKLKENMREIDEIRNLLNKNEASKISICTHLARQVEFWLCLLLREKTIYYTLNKFKCDVVTGVLVGEGWMLKSAYEQVQKCITAAHSKMDLEIPSLVEFKALNSNQFVPPTFFSLNKFTQAFQDFVDTYGIPRYREINPAVFTSISFPFLFGLMFGDIGHGLCIVIFASFLILLTTEKQKKSFGELMNGLYMGRYMLFLMGVFSVYCGFLYNDYFSLGLQLFKSNPPTKSISEKDYIYPFGIDPIWHLAKNELAFYNSFKMKLSVIIGILQMTLGIIIKGLNALNFKDKLEFKYVFLPMIIFDVSIFGYMMLLIFVKWSIDWDHRMLLATCVQDGFIFNTSIPCTKTMLVNELCPLNMGGSGDGCQPPNLVTTLMDIVLSPGTVKNPMYPGQAALQNLLLIIATLCVPVLLFAKPLLQFQQHQKVKKISASVEEIEMGFIHRENEEEILLLHETPSKTHQHQDDSLTELFIHQVIETVEFVLGMVSNTASYLRLWALSLAHTELAKVFWEKTMLKSIEFGNPFVIVLGYSLFAAATFGVLLCMDLLECFLHALRLHWVEFQNKFFKADGYKFEPLDFQSIFRLDLKR